MLINLTPQHLRCAPLHCPAVFKSDQSGRLVIIGKKAPAELARELAPQVGSDEFVVEIDPAFFEEIFVPRNQEK